MDERAQPVRIGGETQCRIRPGRRPDVVVGMCPDERRPGRVGPLDRRPEPVGEGDVLPEPDGDGVGRTPGIEIVVGELQTGDEEQPVLLESTSRLTFDLRQVVGVRLRTRRARVVTTGSSSRYA